MIRVKMIYFAQAREAAGTRDEELRFEGETKIKTAISKAIEAHPKLGRLEEALKVALNEQIVEENVSLHDGDRVALLPPVVGG